MKCPKCGEEMTEYIETEFDSVDYDSEREKVNHICFDCDIHKYAYRNLN